MKIQFNVTGAERKALVAAISHELDIPAKYLGTPHYDYQVGGYNISRDGILTGEDNRDLVAELHAHNGFTPVSEEYDTTTEDTADTAEASASERLPLTEHEELELGREQGPEDIGAQGVFSPQAKIMNRDPMDEDGMRASDVPETDEPGSLTIEMPLERFTATALDNLDKLVASKAALIKKAIGVDALPVERTETTLRFPWFAADTPDEDIAAYTQFIAALCETAKEYKRVTAKEKQVDNEKFAFRVFLIRLGFVGGEYKTARKILMRNLSGNSAFKNGAPPRTGTHTDEPAADEVDTAEVNANNAPADETLAEKVSA